MLLAIDTATRLLSLALHDGDEIVAEITLRTERNQSAILAPLIESTLARSGIAMDDLKALAVCVGPGSYTGLRIGVALAKGMAAARDLPLVPVSSLDSVAAAQPPFEGRMMATVPAGRSRAIWALYANDGADWRAITAAKLGDWDELLADCPAGCLVAGEIDADGMRQLRCALEAGIEIRFFGSAHRLRRAGYLAQLAWTRLRQSGASAYPAGRVVPLYMKAPG